MAKLLVTIDTNGKINEKEIEKIPELDELRAIVGGWIETIPYFTKYKGDPCVAFCNVEGKLHGLPANPVAMAFWIKAFGKPIYEDFLVGNIAIVVGPRSFLREM